MTKKSLLEICPQICTLCCLCLKVTLRRVRLLSTGQAQAKNEHHDNRFQQLQTMLQAKSKSNRKKYFFNQTDD